MKKNIYVLIGLPGSGKGTQAKRLAQKEGMLHLSTGDLVRAKLKQGDTSDPLALEIKKRMEAGVPQPDEVIFDLLDDKLKGLETGVVFDGFPLSRPQAEFLIEYAKAHNWEMPLVINLQISPETAVRRIVERKICTKCGEIYGIIEQKQCLKCGGELVVRADDTVHTAKTRIDHYLPRVNEVLETFRAINRVLDVNGEPQIDDVTVLINQALDCIRTETNV